ncbi:MAG: T9SS type A sorting domain-containing protein [Flavobacteriales bacterium]
MNKFLFFIIANTIALCSASQGLEGIIVEKYYISDAADSMDAAENGAAFPLHVGSVTYRVYADLLPGYKLIQMFGSPANELRIETSTGFYNDPNYGFTTYQGTSVNNTKKRTTLIDSYLSMGGVATGLMGVLKTEDSDGTIDNIHGLLLNNDPDAGSPIVGAGGIDGLMPGTPVLPNILGLTTELEIFDQTPGNLFSTNGGTVAVLGGVEGVTASNHVLLGQFTTNGELCFELNLQIATPVPGESEIYVANSPAVGEFTLPSLSYCSAFVPTPNGFEGIVVEKYYVSDFDDVANAEANNASYPLSNGTVTYRVYADLLPGFKVNQLFGNANHPLDVQTTTSFYNDPLYGFDVYEGTSVANTQTNTTLIDSYFTMGGVADGLSGVLKLEDSDGTIGNLQGILANDDASAGTPITGIDGVDGLMPGAGVNVTSAGFTTELNAFDQTPGSGFSTTAGSFTATNGAEGITASNQILLGQFTTDGVFSFKMNLHISTPVEGEVQTYVAESPIDDEIQDNTLIYTSTDPVIIPPGLDGIVVENYYASDLADSTNAAINGAVYPLESHSVTYRVFADLKPGFKVKRVFGSTGHPLEVTTTSAFYNDPQNGTSVFDGMTVSEAQSNTSLIDSYLTIGAAAEGKMGVLKADDTDGSIGNTQGILTNDDEYVETPITGAGSADGLMAGTTTIPTVTGFTTELSALDQTVGNTLNTQAGEIEIADGVQGVDLSLNHVLLGQFTTYGILSFKFNIELLTPVDGETQIYVAESPQSGQLTHPTLVYESPLPPPHITGVEEIVAHSDSYVAYPNPCHDIITIEQKSGAADQTHIQVTDATGRIIFTTTSGSAMQQIDTSTLPQGVYTIALRKSGGVESIQFIKE